MLEANLDDLNEKIDTPVNEKIDTLSTKRLKINNTRLNNTRLNNSVEDSDLNVEDSDLNVEDSDLNVEDSDLLPAINRDFQQRLSTNINPYGVATTAEAADAPPKVLPKKPAKPKTANPDNAKTWEAYRQAYLSAMLHPMISQKQKPRKKATLCKPIWLRWKTWALTVKPRKTGWSPEKKNALAAC